MATSATNSRILSIQRIIPGNKKFAIPNQLPVLKHEDVTILVRHDDFFQAVKSVFPDDDDIQKKTPTIDLSGPIELWAGGPNRSRRLHAALSFGGEFYSVTIRKATDCEKGWSHTPTGHTNEWDQITEYLKLVSLRKEDWEGDKTKYLATLCSVSDVLFEVAFPETSTPASGLVLVTGGTGSGKTTVLNGLLARYLFRLSRETPDRRPHVVAIGDPVETVFYGGTLFACAEEQLESPRYASRPLDYTARILGTDTPSVGLALQDALRETPSACVISELRRDDDFKATLKFAATGQLVFATAHNTSLVDALRKLMLFSGKDGPSNRSLLAQRLKAVVHLQKIRVAGNQSATLPSVWLGNSPGIRNFVSDGLSSLLPHGETPEADEVGVLGLGWAAKKIGIKHPELLKAANRLDLPIR
jgi:hypothetical protein